MNAKIVAKFKCKRCARLFITDLNSATGEPWRHCKRCRRKNVLEGLGLVTGRGSALLRGAGGNA